MFIACIVTGIVLVAVFLLFIWYYYIHRFCKTPDKRLQQSRLNSMLLSTGFAYEPRGDYFYALTDCWQRKAGYCRLYDEGAPLCNMTIDCEPVAFWYGGKRWLIELRKGQYGMMTGAEIGIYNTPLPDLNTAFVKGTFFESAGDGECLPMAFILRRNGEILLRRKAPHWWLTGFLAGEFSRPEELTMDARIKFPNREMCQAFTESLQSMGYQSHEFSVSDTSVTVHYGKPHSVQRVPPNGVLPASIEQGNENSCRLFWSLAQSCPDTMDKLEYLASRMPELYRFMLSSLYAKEFFGVFEMIRDAVAGQER